MVKHLLIATAITAFSASAAAQNNNTIKAGVGYDLGLGLTAQYNGYSFFLGGDGFAADMRIQNFTNSDKSLNFYVDAGLFVADRGELNDSAGIRAPIGLTLGVARDLQAYVQAVPNIDFGNDAGFGVDGSVGIRFKF